MPSDDAYLVMLHLRDVRAHALSMDGRTLPSQVLRRGMSSFFDLRRNITSSIDEPFHSLGFHLPRAAIAEIGDKNGHGCAGDIVWKPGGLVSDPVIENLGRCLLSAFENGTQNVQTFIDHLLMALRGHVAVTYGGLQPNAMVRRGGLARWQQRKAEELMNSRLVDGIALPELARACGMSTSAFIRGFKKSTGRSPYQWLILRRLDFAMELMSDRRRSLADIALASGFSDQSHFTRIFADKVGMSPGVWRASHVG